MDFKDELLILAERVGKLKDNVKTEEATKTSFVLPFLQALGYDILCKDQGGCAVIYNEQRKQEERDNLELRNLKISRREAHWAIALAIISICASQFWGHTIFEWTWIAMQKISKLLF